MKTIEIAIVDKKAELEDKTKELDALQNKYKSKGGDVVKQRETLYQKKIALTTKINQSKDVLINDAASELPLFMVKNLLIEIKDQSLLEQEKKDVGNDSLSDEIYVEKV